MNVMNASRKMLCTALLLAGCGQPTEPKRTGPSVDGTNTSDSNDTADSTNPTGSTNVDCSDDAAPEVDWHATGPYPVGWRTVTDVSNSSDVVIDRLFAVYYPAVDAGEASEPSLTGAPYPTVFFQHAVGSDYLDYQTIFSHLVSHGFVVVSIDHNAVDNHPTIAPGSPIIRQWEFAAPPPNQGTQGVVGTITYRALEAVEWEFI